MKKLENKKKTVYIFGHKNPDTDSTCAAITYAFLKNQIDPYKVYVPAVLGDINAETSFSMEYFGAEKPVKLDNLRPKVMDMSLEKITPVTKWIQFKRLLKNVNTTGKTLPVADENERLMGIISITDSSQLSRGIIGKK